MARPIKDTPILSGKDAERFVERMMRSEERKETPQERAERMRIYEVLKKMIVD